jgi:hypothetical protein
MNGIDVYYLGEEHVKENLPLAVLIAFSAMLGSCSSFSYLQSDDYVQAGIHLTTDPGAVLDMNLVNRWATEFGPTYNAKDVGVWAANRLAKQGRHDVLILVELISEFDPPFRDFTEDQNMWRISVYRTQAQKEEAAPVRDQEKKDH